MHGAGLIASPHCFLGWALFPDVALFRFPVLGRVAVPVWAVSVRAVQIGTVTSAACGFSAFDVFLAVADMRFSLVVNLVRGLLGRYLGRDLVNLGSDAAEFVARGVHGV